VTKMAGRFRWGYSAGRGENKEPTGGLKMTGSCSDRRAMTTLRSWRYLTLN
jgi:hypothetical protein